SYSKATCLRRRPHHRAATSILAVPSHSSAAALKNRYCGTRAVDASSRATSIRETILQAFAGRLLGGAKPLRAPQLISKASAVLVIGNIGCRRSGNRRGDGNVGWLSTQHEFRGHDGGMMWTLGTPNTHHSSSAVGLRPMRSHQGWGIDNSLPMTDTRPQAR